MFSNESLKLLYRGRFFSHRVYRRANTHSSMSTNLGEDESVQDDLDLATSLFEGNDPNEVKKKLNEDSILHHQKTKDEKCPIYMKFRKQLTVEIIDSLQVFAFCFTYP